MGRFAMLDISILNATPGRGGLRSYVDLDTLEISRADINRAASPFFARRDLFLN